MHISSSRLVQLVPIMAYSAKYLCPPLTICKKNRKQYHIVYWKLYCLRIIFSIPCTLPGIPCVRFQGVQTLCLEYYFCWNSLKRFQWVGGHLCHLKEGVEGSLSIYLLILDTTKNKRSAFNTVIRWQEVHVFTMICVFLLPVSVLHLNATTDRPWVVFASTKSQSASTAYKRTRNVLNELQYDIYKSTHD